VVFFPLDHQLKLKAKHWSEGVLKLVVWLSGMIDYETVEEILEKMGQIHISDSSVWRQGAIYSLGDGGAVQAC
jgi:hypothetical protein